MPLSLRVALLVALLLIAPLASAGAVHHLSLIHI